MKRCRRCKKDVEPVVVATHLVMCGDSTDAKSVNRLLGGAKVDLVFTSPPYNGGSNSLSGNTHMRESRYGSSADDDAFWADLMRGFVEVALLVAGVVVVNVQMLAANKVALVDWIHGFREHLVDVAVWDKGHAPPQAARGVLNSRFEFLWILSPEKDPSRAVPGAEWRGTRDNVYCGPPSRSNEFAEVHAATFPIHLPEWAIDTFTKKGGSVMDPFGGTGTTVIAAAKLGRRAFVVELDARYVDVIRKRWTKFAKSAGVEVGSGGLE